MDGKLIVTYDPNHIASSKEEVEKVLEEIKVKYKFLKSEFDGVFALDVAKAKEVVKKLTKLAKKDKKKGGKLGVAMGMSCKAYRPYEIAFEEPLSEEEYPKLKERMEKKLEEVRRKGSSGSVD